ncbi:hypothetical protein AB205_0198680 [Aquarana catesbeiana]|uniref:Exportin-5 C-terminal domain-containing protein n=1 Tax=Aquarana catesbeiana TaxID=8400 RepID=A0A2G9NB56_AQUCT|nr:hypothetical protein AB205_0198680 [Aquarana catesbeiana]
MYSKKRILQVGFPSKSNSPSCEYSQLDFDSDEDFVTFFNYFKAMMGDVMRRACRLNPHASFHMAAEWLQFQLSAPLDPGPNSSKAGEGLCTLLSPSYIQWEAMTFFCECVFNQVVRVLRKEDLPVSQGVELLQIVLSYQTKDPLILSCLLTNLSALFPFVRYMNGFMPSILTKLFSAVTFELNNKGPRTRSVKGVRRHACASIIKICRDTPELVLPHFNLLSSHAMLLFMDEHLTQMEKYSMLEAQVMISNHFNSYEKQRDFLVQLLSLATSVWSSQETQRAISSPDELISYVGAEMLKGLEEGESPCQANRSQLSLCLYAVEGVLRRARWPSDLEVAKAGGFVVGYTSDGNPIYRNPCSEQALKLLDSIFSLVRTFNNLYLPEVVQKMGEFYAKCLDMMEMEKKCILGLIQPVMDTYDVPVYRSAEERMQGFFCSMYDSCGEDYGEVNTESSEILEIELARLLTRDMVDLLATCCVAKKTSEQSTNNKAEVDGLRGVNQAEAEADEEMMSLEVPLPGSLELTELGMFLMSSEVSADPGGVLPFTDQCLQPTCLDGHTGLSQSRYSAVLAPAKTDTALIILDNSNLLESNFGKPFTSGTFPRYFRRNLARTWKTPFSEAVQKLFRHYFNSDLWLSGSLDLLEGFFRPHSCVYGHGVTTEKSTLVSNPPAASSSLLPLWGSDV